MEQNQVGSLMWHTNNALGFFWASKFMCMLADEIFKREDCTIKTMLKSIIGSSGMGYTYENLGHKELLRTERTYVVKALGSGNRDRFILELPALRLQKFRTIEQINLLDDYCYSMPYASNFPLIDAVIQPDILLQYCTGKKHTGAFNKMELIRQQLHEPRREKHKMIFVNDNMDFGLQANLGEIKQYVMSYTSV